MYLLSGKECHIVMIGVLHKNAYKGYYSVRCYWRRCVARMLVGIFFLHAAVVTSLTLLLDDLVVLFLALFRIDRQGCLRIVGSAHNARMDPVTGVCFRHMTKPPSMVILLLVIR